MIAGLVIVAVSLLADTLGIGTYPGLNNVQLAGILVGVAFFVIGYLLRRKKSSINITSTISRACFSASLTGFLLFNSHPIIDTCWSNTN